MLTGDTTCGTAAAAYFASVTRPESSAEVVAVIERYVDDAHRRVLRSTTDPARGLPRFKKKAEQAQDERIDGAALVAEGTRLRRRLQGIPETAPSSIVSR